MTMIDQIKYYRAVLDELTDVLYPDADSPIKLKWSTGEPERFENQRISHEYGDKVYYNALEARMQLGNILKYISDEPNPYREATLKRLNGDSDEIAEPIDRDGSFTIPEFDTTVETLDYIRELLQEMQNLLVHVLERLDSIEDQRAYIHMDDAINKLALARNYCGKILHCIKNIRDIDNE